MDFAPSLALLYAQFGAPVQLAGAPVTAVWEDEFVDAGGVQCTGPALRCRTADVAAITPGASAVRNAVTYIVRQVQPLPPDGSERRLILERQ